MAGRGERQVYMSSMGNGVCDELGLESGVRCAIVQYPRYTYCALAKTVDDEEAEVVASAASGYFVRVVSYLFLPPGAMLIRSRWLQRYRHLYRSHRSRYKRPI